MKRLFSERPTHMLTYKSLQEANCEIIDLKTLLCNVHDYLLSEDEQHNISVIPERESKKNAVKRAIAKRVEQERLKKLAQDVERGQALLGKEMHEKEVYES